MPILSQEVWEGRLSGSINDRNITDEGLSYEGKRTYPSSGSAVLHISQM